MKGMKGLQHMQSGSYGAKGTGQGGPGAGKTSSTAANKKAPANIGANNSGGKISHGGRTVPALKAGGSARG